MKILGIETSCDETAISVVENGKKILSSVVSSSLHLHSKYGGVVPEIATRHHVESINYVLVEALKKAKTTLDDIDAVSVVHGPGLVGALLVGLSLAKALSYSLKKPLIGVNHLRAHVYAALMNEKRVPFPFVALVVSGGHTSLFYVKEYLKWKKLGNTRDDAAGEAFDKVAKILNLGYPGGPVINKLAQEGNSRCVRFPRSYLEKGSFDFSFSGIKTAVLYYVKGKKRSQVKKELSDIAAGFQEAVVEVLVQKALRACVKHKVKHLVVGGGVVANTHLRELLDKNVGALGIKVHLPDFRLCQDNAAMVAGFGYQLYKKGVRSPLTLEVAPNLK